MKPGELYRAIIKPHWERVSIYEGADTFLREYARDVARNLLSAHWCQSEVCNGGSTSSSSIRPASSLPRLRSAMRQLSFLGSVPSYGVL